MIDKKKKIKSIIAIIILVVIVSTATFAYFGTFSANLTNNVSVNISSSSPGDTTFTTSSAVLELNVPSESMFETNANDNEAVASNSAVLNVSLIGTQSNVSTICTYDIVFEYDTSSNVYGISPTTKTSGIDKEITFEVSSPSGTNHFQTEKNIDYNTSNGWIASTSTTGAKITLVSDATILITSGITRTQSYTVTARYYNLSTFQGQLAGKSFVGKIYVSNYDCSSKEEIYGYETILLQNGGREAIEAKGTPDVTTVETGVVGMYAAEDDFGTSYYFRGKVNNNWVKFGKYTSDMYYNSSDKTLYNTCPDGGSCTKIASNGDDMYWRIIRINGDNSIRMIYTGVTPPTEATQYVMTDSNYSTSIGKSAFNTNYDKSEYVGYMYTLGEQHGISTNSTIKTYLDNWYTFTNLSTYYTNNTSTDLLSDQIICNDRNTSSAWSSTGSFYYAAYDRFSAGSPSLECTTKADRFTVDDVTNGNGALTNPVGLITSDEILLSGADNQYNSNDSFYLYNNDYYWSGSPYGFSGFRGGYAYVFSLSSSYGLNNAGVDSAGDGVRGVVSLSSNAKLSGSGTYDDVYVVS